MNQLRTALSIGVLAVLAFGYAASQVAFFNGSAVMFAKNVDQEPVRFSALGLLLLAVLLSFFPDPEPKPK